LPAIEALKDEKLEVVVTCGAKDAGQIPDIYDLILPRAAIFITNAGFTGTQQALSYGVPLIAAGSSEEKPLVAARIAWSGAGIDLKTGRPTPEQIRDAVRTILSDSSFQLRANDLKLSCDRCNALQAIDEIVNSTLASKKHAE